VPENALKWEAVHPEPERYDFARADVIARTGADAEIFAKTALLLGAAKAEEYLAGHDALGWSLTH